MKDLQILYSGNANRTGSSVVERDKEAGRGPKGQMEL